MKRIYLLVEGQTEETFVRELLAPHYIRLNLALTPIIFKTSPGHKGGISSYPKVKRQIVILCQDTQAYVTTMFDLYALPDCFPGKAERAYPTQGTGQQKAEYLEVQLAGDINKTNFIPNLIVHEFEALLFVKPNEFAQWTDDEHITKTLNNVRHSTTPENINDAPLTAPSKRILKVMSGYQKPFHGPLIACAIGLDAIRADCPHFNDWLNKIEALA